MGKDAQGEWRGFRERENIEQEWLSPSSETNAKYCHYCKESDIIAKSMGVIIGVVIYIAIGVIRVISDYRQPRHNQPDYVRHPRWWFTLLVVIGWPILIIAHRGRW